MWLTPPEEEVDLNQHSLMPAKQRSGPTGVAPRAPAVLAVAAAISAARGALKRYRVMALVTGVTLIVFTAEILTKYVLGTVVDVSGVLRWVWWIPFVHGWVFVAYLVTVVQLWLRMRWAWGRLVVMVLAGAVPGTSFVMERRVCREAARKLDLLEQRHTTNSP